MAGGLVVLMVDQSAGKWVDDWAAKKAVTRD